MKKRKNGWLVLIISIFIILVILLVIYILRADKKSKLDAVLQKDYVLEVNFGIVPKEHKLQENNKLIKQVDKENYYYFIITEENDALAYFLDWYYFFDPMQGYNVDYNKKLDEKTIKDILERVKEKAIEDLNYKNVSEYLSIKLDYDHYYIDKKDMQYILQDHDIMLNI